MDRGVPREGDVVGLNPSGSEAHEKCRDLQFFRRWGPPRIKTKIAIFLQFFLSRIVISRK